MTALTCQDRPEECVCCYSTCCVGLKGVDKIVQRTLEYREESKADQYSPNTRCYPNDASVGSPAEDEKARSETYRASHLR